jgi:hypothetical protein
MVFHYQLEGQSLRYFAEEPLLAVGTVVLNPERDCVVKQHSVGNDIQQMAA